MPLLLGAVADDYTGASDLANTLSRNGLSTVQTIGVPAAGFEAGDAEAIVIALKIRSVEAPRAVAAATAGYDWLVSRGTRHVMYKICSTFDSTDSGNIGPVGEAFRARAGTGCILVTPAFPETGRTVYLGHLFVGLVPLNESPLKDHPLNPMRDSNLVRVLQRQSNTHYRSHRPADRRRGRRGDCASACRARTTRLRRGDRGCGVRARSRGDRRGGGARARSQSAPRVSGWGWPAPSHAAGAPIPVRPWSRSAGLPRFWSALARERRLIRSPRWRVKSRRCAFRHTG